MNRNVFEVSDADIMNEMKLIPIDSIHVNYINIIFDTYAILFFIMYFI